MQMTQRFIERTMPCQDCNGTGKVRYLVVFRKMCPCCHGWGRVKLEHAVSASVDTGQSDIVPLSIHERINRKVAFDQPYQETPIIPSQAITGTPQPIIVQETAPQNDYNPGLVPPPPPAIPPTRPVIVQNPDEPKLYVNQRRFRLYKQVAPPFHPQHPLKDKLRKNIKLMTEIEGIERTYYLVKD